jgi:uncharacterized membrane protein YjgN (DUF898 family)
MNRRLYCFLFSWVDLAQAIIGVLTLGVWYPNWTLRFAGWYALHTFKKRGNSK